MASHSISDTGDSFSYRSAYIGTEQELSRHIPPWSKATCLQKLMTTVLYTGIYFPVFVLISLVGLAYTIYCVAFIWPLISDSEPSSEVFYWHSASEQERARTRGILYFLLMSWFVFWFFFSHIQAMSTGPGHIPLSPEWNIPSDESSESSNNTGDKVTELRKDGTRRTCGRCQKRKPDRAHHCKQCETCNLKMDHHCNWIANCVGHYNYKYFFLMVLHGSLMLVLFIGTFWECVVVSLHDPDHDVSVSFIIVLTYSLLCMLGVAVVGFCFFHLWLIKNNYTTIEYCEKKRRSREGYGVSPYNRGTMENFKEALGQCLWSWTFPFNYRTQGETGLHFTNKECD